MAQRLTPSVRAGDAVLLLAIVTLQLPSGAAGGRLALAGTLFAVGLCMSGGLTTTDRDRVSGRSSCGNFVHAAVSPRSSGTSAVTGARRAGRAP